MPGPAQELLVDEKTLVAEGVAVVRLSSADGRPLPHWAAGAHIDLVLPDGTARQYSLCGRPADRAAWRIAVLREPAGRGGSAYVHDELHPGTKVTLGGLRNNFPLLPAERYLFIAGGIGITPVLPMIEAAEAAGVPWTLLYGGRSRASMAFLDELAGYGERVTVAPQDEVGLLDLDRALAGLPAGARVYCCGPEPLLAAVEDRLAGHPAGTLQLERFRPLDLGPAASGGFEVELASTGTVLAVPADRSVLEVLEAAGVDILSSCREGTCGTCETGVLAGDVEHRDALLDADERAANDVMFVCVSRSLCPRLVLDL